MGANVKTPATADGRRTRFVFTILLNQMAKVKFVALLADVGNPPFPH